MIRVYANRLATDVEYFTFSDGSVHIKPLAVRGERNPDHIDILAHLQTPADQMALIMTADALRRMNPSVTLSLTLPFLPYARQDRVCAAGESFALKVFGTLINGLDFDKVVIMDPHSYVAEACIDRMVTIDQLKCIQGTGLDYLLSEFKERYVLCAPDAGAVKKTWAVARHYGVPMISCDKKRNVHTGEIEGIVVNVMDRSILQDKTILVIDDICDGGATFLALAKALEGYDLELYVTHGIFSKGTDELLQNYSRIYTTDSWAGRISGSDNENLSIYSVKRILSNHINMFKGA